jgi:hypothetical protein
MPTVKSNVPAAEGLAAAVVALAGGLAAGLSLGSSGTDVPHLLSPLEVHMLRPAASSSSARHSARHGARVAHTRYLWPRADCVAAAAVLVAQTAALAERQAGAAGRRHRR